MPPRCHGRWIGRRLHPLLAQVELETICVEPRIVYVDSSRPEWVDGFTNKTFIAMVEGVRDDAVAAGLISADRFDAGVLDLRRTTEADGVFCYTFFKGVGLTRRTPPQPFGGRGG